LITLGVADLARARGFYEQLGWRGREVDETVFYQGPGHVIVLWARPQLAADAGIDDHVGGDGRDSWGGVALAHNVGSRAEVDEIMGRAAGAGAAITKPAAETFYGGYAGYFADPDGHVWEIAHNPGFPLAPDGTLRLPAALQVDRPSS
jgi:predicted lactoylglutathione lyase